MKKMLKTAELMARLYVKFGDIQKGWAMLEQVAATSGFNHGYSDAIAVQLWPSRGIQLLGFEVKASRGDWLRELKNRMKTERSAFVFMDQWWVVANAGCVADGELPQTWGLMEPHGRGLRIVREAPYLEPQQLDPAFLAAVLRRAAKAGGFDRKSIREDAHRAGYDEGRKYGASLAADRTRRADEQAKVVQVFQQASGVNISSYNAGEIGAAVRAVMNGAGKVRLERLRETLAQQVAGLDVALGQLQDDTGESP